MTASSIAPALRLLGHFWLEEATLDDIKTIAALPELAQTIPHLNPDTITNLAVEYQRLFGFNLPLYESIFVDPSAMMMAPATQLIQLLYHQADWKVPDNVRAGAPDHLGLELSALADALATHPGTQLQMASDFAHRLHVDHLALWVPPLILALQSLKPHPFYAMLGELTLDLILATLPPNLISADPDPFPTLPPPPVYKGSDEMPDLDSTFSSHPTDDPTSDEPDTLNLRTVIKRLLPPREAGLFLTREDIAHIGQALNSPGVMGERYRMLESLFQFAGQYDLIPELLQQLSQTLTHRYDAYQQIAAEYPAWSRYADAWCDRLNNSQTLLDELSQFSRAVANVASE